MSLSAQQFADPTTEYRPSPLWAWNDKMTPELIRRQLREMKDCGFGGAFVNPRPGLVNPYLSEEWFSLWAVALEESEKIGLKLYIYDENSYPSGFAGGHVPSELPDCLAQAVVMRELAYEELSAYLPIASGMLNKPGHPIRVFAISLVSSEEVDSLRDVTDLPYLSWPNYGDKFLMFEIGMPETNAWLGGFAYTDLLRPEVTESFLHHTYEAYRNRFGDRFGSVIPAIFTDEPEISPGNLFRQAGADFLPFSYWFAGQFEARKGYDLKDYLPCLFRDIRPDSMDRDPVQVRYDYYDMIHELWVDNFVRPISTWCETNGIAWSGHYVEHNWPYPWGRSSPAVMSLYEYMQWPAIDLLRSNSLRQPGNEGAEMLMLTIREASSAANQFDRARVVCEAYGAGGWDSNFQDYKRIGDWLFAHGINFLTPHLVLASLAGARKRDHPQSFDWRQAWWKEYGELNDYFARLSYVLSQGETRNRVLLLNPCLSGYLETPGEQQGELRVNEAPRHPDMARFLKIAQKLCDNGWNYDLGDEYILERHGGVDGNLLAVGKRGYDVVIYPDSMTTMRASTFSLLERYLQAGGVVLALGEPGARIDGRLDASTRRLAEYIGWRKVEHMEDVGKELAAKISRDWYWPDQQTVPAGVHHLRRELPDGSSVYFFVNSGMQAVDSTLEVTGAFAERWDLWAGEVKVMDVPIRNGRLHLDLQLPPEGSALLRIYDRHEQKEGRRSLGSRKATSEVRIPFVGRIRVAAEQDNWLVLDYCDLEVGRKCHVGISTLHAQKLVFEYHGFDANPWDNAVQFKRRLIDRNHFASDSGFTVRFRFRIAKGGLPSKLKLWAERATSYRLKVNGRNAEWSKEISELDQHLQSADIGGYVREGENVVELQVQPFDLHLEVEPVYLTGEFAVRDEEGHWSIDQPMVLSIGSWREQGYPFYGHAVTYEQTAILEDITSRRYFIRLQDGAWEGTVVSLQVNGRSAGLLGVGTGQEVEVTSLLRQEDNRFVLRVSGSFKNLMGPFHDPSRTRKTAWPANWKLAPIQGPPSAAEYDLLDYGLFEEFELIARA